MEGKLRRAQIVSDLEKALEPVTGAHLASMYTVSRQVIVQDIALLRAQGVEVISTTAGYMIYSNDLHACKRVFAMEHDQQDIQDELETIIAYGGEIIDVIVTHPVYGEISANLMIKSKIQLDKFLEKLDEVGFVPLLQLTKGIHYHTIAADTEATLNAIEEALLNKGYLYQEV